jgi:hypothetical protein
MMANSTRLRASQTTFAPRSSITTSPRAEGVMAASAGRPISGMVLMTILAIAISAPVLPAETTPAASPCATASIASRMEDWRTRSASVGFMSPGMALGAWRIAQTSEARGRVASRGVSRASSPTSRKRAWGCRSAASSRPSRMASGAPSPPMASIAREKRRRLPSAGADMFTPRRTRAVA